MSEAVAVRRSSVASLTSCTSTRLEMRSQMISSDSVIRPLRRITCKTHAMASAGTGYSMLSGCLIASRTEYRTCVAREVSCIPANIAV